MPHTVHYPEQPSQGHVTPPPSRDAPVRFVLCCVAKTDNIRIYLVLHDEFTQRLIEEGKMVSKSKAHCRRMLQALQQTRAGIFDQLENCQHTLPEYIAISSETSATLTFFSCVQPLSTWKHQGRDGVKINCLFTP